MGVDIIESNLLMADKPSPRHLEMTEMASKQELQTILREEYGINKNISQSLGAEDCEQLLLTLQRQPSAAKLVNSFAEKNAELGNRNRHFGSLRSNAESKLQTLQSDYQQLETQVAQMEKAKAGLENRRDNITVETKALASEIRRLQNEKQLLNSRVQTLTTQKEELSDANMELKKDNKDLKNTVDQIRLQLARNIKALLQYEDNEIKKAMIRLLGWTLG